MAVKEWECPKMTCYAFMVDEQPYLPCARHGLLMIERHDFSFRKRGYQATRRLAQRLKKLIKQ